MQEAFPLCAGTARLCSHAKQQHRRPLDKHGANLPMLIFQTRMILWHELADFYGFIPATVTAHTVGCSYDKMNATIFF